MAYRDILGGMETEYFFACPYCRERISMLLDTSVKKQTYIEDCEVCCSPIEVHFKVKGGEIAEFEARALQ
jgi:hypothetical protein